MALIARVLALALVPGIADAIDGIIIKSGLVSKILRGENIDRLIVDLHVRELVDRLNPPRPANFLRGFKEDFVGHGGSADAQHENRKNGRPIATEADLASLLQTPSSSRDFAEKLGTIQKAQEDFMRLKKKVLWFLAVATVIGGLTVLGGHASAQTAAPGQATCQGACGYALGSCAGAAAQGMSACVTSCGKNVSCISACVQGLQGAITECRNEFSDICLPSCS